MAAAIRQYITFFLLPLSEGIFENVALNKHAEMSSLYNLTEGKDYSAGNAVDGDKRTLIHTAAEETSAWWTVDLGRMVQDPRVTIFFRTDFTLRRKDTKFYTSAAAFTEYPQGNLCYTVPDNSQGVITRTCTGTWRHLMFYRDTKLVAIERGVYLDFFEATVITCDVNSYSYADNCTKLCSSRQCAGTSVSCPSNTGACAEGCLPGWRGNDCATECSSGMYGPGCGKLCVERNCVSVSDTCHHVTGTCPDTCRPGWTGTDCTQECGSGRYGRNCQMFCCQRHCVNQTSECDPENGVCPQECAEGWVGQDCTSRSELEPCKSEAIIYITGIFIGVFVTLMVNGVILFCLKQRGRLQWKSSSGQTSDQSNIPAIADIGEGRRPTGRDQDNHYEIPVVTDKPNEYEMI